MVFIKNWIKTYWKSILFNVFETAIIFFSGWWLLSSWEKALIIMLSFVMVKMILGRGLHYKSWVKCLFWSYAVLLVLFFVANVNFTISLLLSMFSAVILTNHCNINEVYQFGWQHRERKHWDVILYIRRNADSPVVKELDKLVEEHSDKGVAVVYKYIWLENQTYQFCQEILNCESREISRLSDVVAMLFSRATVKHLNDL